MKDVTAAISNVVHLLDAHNFLTTTRKEKMLCLYGKPGLGKSQGCDLLSRQERALYFQCPPNPTPYAFVRALAIKINAPYGRSLSGQLQKLVEFFQSARRSLMMDEAGRMFWRHRDKLAEICRYIHDEANIPVILVGIEDLPMELSRYPQLADRIHFLEFQPWTKEDVALVAKTCCEVRLNKDLLQAIYKFTGGNGRLVTRCFEHIERHGQALGLESIGVKEWGNQPFLPAYSLRRKLA